MLINLQHVEKVYKTRGADVHALRGVDFQAHKGEFVAIVGPSGSGKSTLINMITGIDQPTSGEVYVAGQRLTQMGEDAIARWRGKQIGVVFQFFQLLPTLSVIDNLMMPMRYTNTWRGKRRQRALELLERVGIPETADQFPSQLSGGHQQRAAIARALVNDPQILIGDEPTGNLDPASSNRIMALFRELVAQGTTIVMVTHDHDLAGQLPRVVEVRDGRLLSQVDERLVASVAR
jgi:putative ABC transport system ATP-binding protein